MLSPGVRRAVAGSALVLFVLGTLEVLARAGAGHAGFADDAYYYIIVARNLAWTGVPTFDGATATSGFHPLWLAIQAAAFALLGTGITPETQVWVVVAMERALLGLAVLGAVGVLLGSDRDEEHGLAVAVLVALTYPGVARLYLLGMETTLAGLLFLLGARFWVRGRDSLAGIAFGFLVLARLDTFLWVVLPLAGISAVRSMDPRRGVALAAPAVLAFGGYAALLAVLQGDPRPISGVLKSTFPWPHPQPSLFLDSLEMLRVKGFGWPVVILGHLMVPRLPTLAAGWLLAAGVWTRRTFEEQLRAVPWFLVAGLLLANLLLFQRWAKPVEPWYLVLPLLALALAAGRVGSARVLGGVAVLVLGLGAAREVVRIPGALRSVPAEAPRTDFERAVREATSPDAVLAGTDVGHIAFWTGRRVVNLDGLMNDFAFQQELVARPFGEVLRGRGVEYLLVRVWDRAPPYLRREVEPMYRARIQPEVVRGPGYAELEYSVFAHAAGKRSTGVRLRPGDEVVRAAPHDDLGVRAVDLLFRLP